MSFYLDHAAFLAALNEFAEKTVGAVSHYTQEDLSTIVIGSTYYIIRKDCIPAKSYGVLRCMYSAEAVVSIDRHYVHVLKTRIPDTEAEECFTSRGIEVIQHKYLPSVDEE